MEIRSMFLKIYLCVSCHIGRPNQPATVPIDLDDQMQPAAFNIHGKLIPVKRELRKAWQSTASDPSPTHSSYLPTFRSGGPQRCNEGA